MTETNTKPPLLSLLVVEDSPTQAIFLRQRLVRGGFSVRLAANGKQALEEIARERPTLVLTDLDMPEMNGLELVQQLRRRGIAVPVILMTAAGSEEIAVQALRAGATGYVPKQKLDRDLSRTMEGVLAIARSQRDQRQLGDILTASGAEYLLPNDPDLIPPLVRRLQQNLARLQTFDEASLLRIGMALREALVNAMEHGNLEASSSLREHDDGSYHRLINERQKQEPYQSRRVRLKSEESIARVRYVISDDGPGFDPGSLPDPTDPENLGKTSGRGLLLIRAFMDDVEFNASGNQIQMHKARVGSVGGDSNV